MNKYSVAKRGTSIAQGDLAPCTAQEALDAFASPMV